MTEDPHRSLPLVPTFAVICLPRPMNNERDSFTMGEGCSIEDTILEAAYRLQRPVTHFADAVVILDDQIIAKEQWSIVRPQRGQQLIVRIVPGQVVVPLLFAAMAAAATPAALSALTGLAVTAGAALVVSASIEIVGSITTRALRPRGI